MLCCSVLCYAALHCTVLALYCTSTVLCCMEFKTQKSNSIHLKGRLFWTIMKCNEVTVCRLNLPQHLLPSYYGIYLKVWSVLFLFILERSTQSPSLKGRVCWSHLARMRFEACWCICVRWVRSNGHDFLSFRTVVLLFYLTYITSYFSVLIINLSLMFLSDPLISKLISSFFSISFFISFSSL